MVVDNHIKAIGNVELENPEEPAKQAKSRSDISPVLCNFLWKPGEDSVLVLVSGGHLSNEPVQSCVIRQAFVALPGDGHIVPTQEGCNGVWKSSLGSCITRISTCQVHLPYERRCDTL